jgi:hypothetical protein
MPSSHNALTMQPILGEVRGEGKAGGVCRVGESSASFLSLSKKQSQAKSYKVRGQSDIYHTSVNFMPAFPWHQMRGEFSHKSVSALSYILVLHIAMPRIFVQAAVLWT